ncbi:p21-activated protein kinase-interacting protein 1-like [Portunus trituberculatus]|uniref:p21-activated protein kinase-interacting protein 1-like n=1 Tax=Portunus trituberculatus TaxID=210409 RepID=UPI001E1CFED0|nr:p21-activated protein kinase-interacting protein 1-like [Portunus trituberculatus]
MKRKLQIIVGTNEEFVLGYDVTQNEDGRVSLHQFFADHSHNGSVRQVAVGGKILASGAADETIRVFNLSTRTEVGIIMEHQGTISSLGFHETTHLFSAAEDGNICIYKQGKWQCEKTLRGHRGGVVDLAVHPSGKMALSIGRDNTLRTWNLIKGRKAYITKLKGAADAVHWNPKGTQYLLVKGSCVDVYEVDTGRVEHSIDFKEHISALTFVTDDIIAVGGEGKNICLYDIATKIEMGQWAAHASRVKCLCTLPGIAAEELWLVSASSDGIIKVWSLELLSLCSEPKLLGEVNTTCRIICMDVYQPACTPALDTDPAGLDEYASSEEEKEIEEEEEEEEYKGIKRAEQKTPSKLKLERKKHKRNSQGLSSKTKKIKFK